MNCWISGKDFRREIHIEIVIEELISILQNNLHGLFSKMIPFETVYPAAGDDHSAVRLSVDELEQSAGAKGWVDVCKEA